VRVELCGESVVAEISTQCFIKSSLELEVSSDEVLELLLTEFDVLGRLQQEVPFKLG